MERKFIHIEHSVDVADVLGEMELVDVLEWYKLDMGAKEFAEVMSEYIEGEGL